MGMIRLDLAVIGEGARNASSLAKAFDGTDGVAGAAADACGHGDLAGTIRDFESTWSHRRDEFAEQLDTVAAALGAVHEAFTTLDRDLASEG